MKQSTTKRLLRNLASILMMISACTARCASGPVAQYNFDDGTGVVANDSSGNGYAGTLTNGPVWTTGLHGNALSFNGANQFVLANTSPNLNGSDFTLSAWIYRKGSNTVILGKWDDGANKHQFDFFVDINNKLNLDLINANGSDVHVACPNQLTTQSWYHVATTVTAATKSVAMYINGSAQTVSQPAWDGTIQNVAMPMYIGANPQGYYWNGIIDDVKVYNRALSAAEIQTLAQFPPPVATGDSYVTAPGQALNVAAPGVLINDTAIIGSSNTAVRDANVAHGALSLNANGSFTYTPNGGYSGPDSFTYHAVNSSNVSSATVTVTINVENLSVNSIVPMTGVRGQVLQNVTVSGTGFKSNSVAIPQNAVVFNGHSYLYVTTPMEWHAAKAYCANLGGHLATINSASENAFIQSMITSLAWIGLTDEAVEGTFVWVDNEPLVYTNWGAGEPNNNAGVEDWVVMRPENGTWNDTGTDSFGFVCEFDSLPTAIKLKKGATEILGTNVRVNSSSQLLADFNLTGAVTGSWDVVATDPDTSITAALPGGFQINPASTSIIEQSVAPITYKTTNQTITLNATVTPQFGTLNEGIVSFQLLDASNSNAGMAVNSGTVSNGATGNVTYTIPGDTPAGTYTISASYTGTASFAASVDISKQLTINKAVLTVTGKTYSRAYGAGNPTLDGTLTGAGDGITASYSTDATVLSNVGDYDVVPTLHDPNIKLGNYLATITKGTLSVTQAPLTAAAANAHRLYGDDNPDFSGILSGVLNGDNILALYGSEATPETNVGHYAITPSLLDPDVRLGNYSVNRSNGTLTINPAPLSVTPADASRPYGAPNPDFSGTIVGIKNMDDITATYASDAVPLSDLGTYPITATFNDPDNRLPNYLPTYNSGTLTVVEAVPPEITSLLTASTAKDAAFTYVITADGSAPMTFTADGLPDGLSIADNTIEGNPTVSGIFDVTLTASNIAGSDMKILKLAVTQSGANHPPTFDSPPIASANPVTTGTAVTLMASATDIDGDTLDYTWNFGDDTTVLGSSVSKTYASAGVYLVSVVVSDGQSSDTQSLTLIVEDAPPSGTFAVQKVAVSFNFTKGLSDSLTLSGTIPLPPAFSAMSSTVRVVVGTLDNSYMLNAAGASPGKVFTLKGNLHGTNAKFTYTVKKQDLFAKLSDLGFTKTEGGLVTLPVVVVLNGTSYLDSPQIQYKVTHNRKGPVGGTGKK